MKTGFLILTCLLLFTNCLIAKKIEGIVVDSETRKPVPYVNIIVLRTNKGVISDINGKFQIDANPGDSLMFSSIGYESMFKVIQSIDSLYIMLNPKTYFLGEVKVYSEEYVPLRYKSEVYPEGDPHILNSFFQPLSFMYYKFSKKEKSKRKIRELMEYERRMARVMSIYNKKLVQEFTGLSGKELDDCLIYCNAHIQLDELDNEFTIKYKLLKILSDYKKENLKD